MRTIKQLTSQDSSHFPAALEILNRLQGRDIFPTGYLEALANDHKSFVLAVFDGEVLVGAAVAQILERYEYYVSFGQHLVDGLQGRRVGTLATMAIHENYQGKGLGQQLSRARLDWLKKQNCDVVLGVSWVSGLPHTSHRVFEKLGFKAVARHELFYKEVSVVRDFICPACGAPPCHCPAILYMMETP